MFSDLAVLSAAPLCLSRDQSVYGEIYFSQDVFTSEVWTGQFIFQGAAETTTTLCSFLVYKGIKYSAQSWFEDLLLGSFHNKNTWPTQKDGDNK